MGVHGRSVWGLGLLWTGSCSRLWLLGLWLWVGPRGLCEPCFVAVVVVEFGRGHWSGVSLSCRAGSGAGHHA